MKRIYQILTVVILVLSGLGAIGTSSEIKSTENVNFNSLDDLSYYKYIIASESSISNSIFDPVDNMRLDYPIGTTIWQYTISTSWDNSPKAISSIPDINDDGIDDVIVCSEDDYVRCFDGGAIGSGVILWEHQPNADVYLRKGLSITEDIDGDGYQDLVFGTNGGTYNGRLIRTLSGDDGSTIWTHDTHEYGTGGWVYSVDTSYDYNNDDVLDVLAATGDDSTDTGPKRIYCLDGSTGISIWECPLGGPGFEVIGVEDFTGDGHPDVVTGCSNEAETIGYARGINGATGIIEWTFSVPGTSVWAVEQLDDVTGDGVKDIIIGDFYSTAGNIYAIDPTDGSQIYHQTTGALMHLHFEKIEDVNSDGYTDIVPSHTNHYGAVINGYTGDPIWIHNVADQAWNTARIGDVSGDGIDDVIVGTLFQSNYCYFLNGVDGSELISIAYGEAIDAIASIPDVVNDGSMEMVVGGRNGKVTCISGGLDSSSNPIQADFTADPTEGKIPLIVQFTDLSTAENSTIISWEWDFDGDGTVDSYDQNPEWTYTEAGSYTVELKVSDGTIFSIETKEDYITALPSDPDLNCEGSLSWTEIEPGATVTDSFIVENIGEPLSLLDWEVLSYPDWGNWTFIPNSGTELPEGDSITIEVEVEAPNEENTEFSGEIILVNSNDPDDTCTIDVSLATPVSQQISIYFILQRIFERFPNAFPILRQLLGL